MRGSSASRARRSSDEPRDRLGELEGPLAALRYSMSRAYHYRYYHSTRADMLHAWTRRRSADRLTRAVA